MAQQGIACPVSPCLGKWLQPSLWKSRKQTVWVREREKRKARITVWVGIKEKEMGKRKENRKWFGLYVGV